MGGSPDIPPPASPSPIRIQADARKAQDDIRRRLSRSRGRDASTVAGYLETPPAVSNLALSGTLG